MALAEINGALRRLRKSPGLAMVIVVSLAIGIAVSGVFFSFINTVLFRAGPLGNAAQIVSLTTSEGRLVPQWSQVPFEVVEAVRKGSRSFRRVAAYRERRAIVENPTGRRKQIFVTEVDTGVLPMISLRLARGRLPTSIETQQGATVALVSDSLWRNTFGDGKQDGATIRIFGRLYDVIGVLPRGTQFYLRSDVIVPFSDVAASEESSFGLIGALRMGQTPAKALADFRAIGKTLAEADPQYARWLFMVNEGLYDRMKGLPPPQFLWMFLAVATCVLLIACSNVTTVLLMRCASQSRELAIRAAMGASRGRLVRHVLSESVVLSVAAALLGIGLTIAGSRLLAVLLPLEAMPPWMRWGTDFRVVLFCCVLAFAVLAIVGLTPAMRSSLVHPASILRGTADGIVSPAEALRSGKQGIVTVVAVSTALCTCGLLMFASYRRLAVELRTQDDDGQYIVRLAEPEGASNPTRIAESFRNVATRVEEQLPGIRAAVSGTPMRFSDDKTITEPSAFTSPLYLTSQESKDRPAPSTDLDLRAVSEGYFEIAQLRFVRGHAFDASATRGASLHQAVVSEHAAATFWPGQIPLGKTLRLGKNGLVAEVVGIVEDQKTIGRSQRGLTMTPRPSVYFRASAATPYSPVIALEVQQTHAKLHESIQEAVTSIAPGFVVISISSASAQRQEWFFVIRVLGTLVGGFAILGLLFAAIGTYGVVAYGVIQRTHEVGLRLALGSSSVRIAKMLLLDALRPFGIGVLIGLAIAAFAAQFLRSILFSVSAIEPLIFCLVAVICGLVALAACLGPMMKAMRLTPMEALRAAGTS
jgi:putative ABC transport system permease protein